MAEAMRGATRVRSLLSSLTFSHQLTLPFPSIHPGYGVDEPRPQSPRNPEDYERLREGELNDGHEGGNDV